jgi:hypothetical protein
MTLYEFNNLTLEEKYEFVWTGLDRRLIAFRDFENQKIALFDCGTFFAETYFLPAVKRMLKIEGFCQDDSRLDSYIEFAAKYDSESSK